MKVKKVVMACANFWTTPLQVGSHHIARSFEKNGWEVAFVSDPISPLHFLKRSFGLKDRYALYQSGGIEEGNIWSYVPGGLLTPYHCSFLKSRWLHKNWHKLTFPSVVSTIKKKGFAIPDLLYLDSPLHAFWQKLISPKYSIYRLADYNKAFGQTAPAKALQEERLLSEVDCVIYTAKTLKNYVASLHPNRMEYIPNGVDFSHFIKEQSQPFEYKNFQGSIAVYVGALSEWFDAQLVCIAAKALPHWHFVIIGPNKGCSFEKLPNLHLLGARSWSVLPSYLQHADVGIIPFDVKGHPKLIHRVSPLKLYEYMASGLPVVSMKWDELTHLNTPALLASSKEEFISLIEKAKPSHEYTAFAKQHDWNYSGKRIIELCRNLEKRE